MTILRKRIIFQHKDYPRGKTLPNLYAKFLFRVSVLPFYQNTRGVRSVDREAVVEKITVVGWKQVIVSLLDGTEIECDATSF